MSGPGLYQELKRRHVVRVAVAYAAAAWVVLQLAGLLLPTFGAPAWVLKVLVGLVALLFPIALVLAWAFEITPEGVRRTVPEGHEAERAPEAAHRVGRTLNGAIIGALGLAVVLLAWRLVVVRRGGGASAPDRSIAVLPFESLSADSANAYFASGMQDMILTKLAAIEGLKVISRTSTESYGSRPENLRTIGRELGVASVLEGSVQKAGQQVLVNVQLIDARTDGHLWAESYTRTLENVFGVEGEVAGKVADALRTTLSPAEQRRVAAPPTTDAAAYDLYLQADAHARRAYDNNGLSSVELPRAIPLYEAALARDSGFALAAAALGTAHMTVYWFGPDRTEARLAAAREAADRALRLQPDLGQGHLALALWYYWGHRNYDAGIAQLEAARKALPSSAEVQADLAAIERRKGEWERSLASFRKATLLDPRRPDPFAQLGLTYQMLRRYGEADSAFARAGMLEPESAVWGWGRAVNTLLWKGDLGPFRSLLSRLQPGSDLYRATVGVRFQVLWLDRDYEAAIRAARSDTASSWDDANNVALPRALRVGWALEAAGRPDSARQVYAAVRSRMQQALAGRPDEPDLH
ncbi:MAG TPA: hypothetical protein VKA44_07805, partial [Gemmatimonadota bacterium]|nr:hypothetical protein [Gemmatimonadota bacterium]